MQKINLAEERIGVDKSRVLSAINSGKPFGISVEGEVLEAPLPKERLYIFQGGGTVVKPSPMAAAQPTLADFFGPAYKIEEREGQIVIDASEAWNEIVPLNREGALYDDTTNDGVMDFADEALEDMSWHAVEFGVTNRHIADVIEERCEGRIFCLHREAPFHFSALVYVDDIEDVREKVHAAIAEKIGHLLQSDPDYHPEMLDEDQEEAVAFFGVKPAAL